VVHLRVRQVRLDASKEAAVLQERLIVMQADLRAQSRSDSAAALTALLEEDLRPSRQLAEVPLGTCQVCEISLYCITIVFSFIICSCIVLHSNILRRKKIKSNILYEKNKIVYNKIKNE
jgi:hypothetical protein